MRRKKIEQDSPKSPQLEEVGERIIDHIEKSRLFEPWTKPQIGTRFVILKEKGDYVQGVLYKSVQNFHRSASYPIEQDDGTIVELFGSRLLHHLIKKYDLIGQRVRIVYIGRQYTYYGVHARKIYRIFKVKGCFTENLESVGTTEQAKPQKRSKKNERAKTNS